MGICSSNYAIEKLNSAFFGDLKKNRARRNLELSPKAAFKLSEKLRLTSQSQLRNIETLFGNIFKAHEAFLLYHLGGEHRPDFSDLNAKIPADGEGRNLWFLFQAVCFVKSLQVFHNLATTRFCSSESCPILSVGALYEYRWRDPDTGDILSTCAPSYMHLLFDFVDGILKKSELSSISYDCAADLLRRTFRVYAHIYHEHYSEISLLGLTAEFEARLNHLSQFLIKTRIMTVKELLPMRTFFSGKLRSGCPLIIK
jgi:MOB kinase activator 1